MKQTMLHKSSLGGIMPLRGQNNVQGAGDMGCLPNQLTGGLKVINEADRKVFEDAWGVKIPAENGNTQTRMLEKMSDNEGGLHYPCPTVDHPGTFLLHERFHEGRALAEKSRFVPVDFSLPAEPTDMEYPLTLTTGRRYEQYNTNSQTVYYPPNIKLKQTEETVDMHADDAASLNIEDGEYVEVASRRGKVKVKVKICNKMQKGDVFMSFHWAEVPTNALTIDEFDPISGTAEYKACAVKISKIDDNIENG